MRKFKAFVTLTSTCLLLAGCGPSKDLGQYCNLLILPTNVIISPGPYFTCLDIKNAATTGSGTGPVAEFPKARIDWTSPDHSLLISTIRVTVTGNGVTNGTYTYQATPDEIAAMWGSSTIPANMYSDSTDATSQSTREISRGIGACGFVISSIPLIGTTTTPTPSFRARMKIELIGTSLSADYTDQQFVKQTVYTTADYIAF